MLRWLEDKYLDEVDAKLIATIGRSLRLKRRAGNRASPSKEVAPLR